MCVCMDFFIAAVCIPRLPHFVNTQEMQKSQLESFAETKRVLLGIQLESQVATSHQQRAARMSCALAEMLGIPQHSDEGKGRTTVVDDLASIDKSGKLVRLLPASHRLMIEVKCCLSVDV